MASLSNTPTYKWGADFENLLEKWLISQRWRVKSLHGIVKANGEWDATLKGADRNTVLPDLDVGGHGMSFFVEAKRKSRTPWNRNHQMYVHGIDKPKYEQYIFGGQEEGKRVWIFLLEEKTHQLLALCIYDPITGPLEPIQEWEGGSGKRRDGKDNGPMVYWPRRDFLLLAELEPSAQGTLLPMPTNPSVIGEKEPVHRPDGRVRDVVHSQLQEDEKARLQLCLRLASDEPPQESWSLPPEPSPPSGLDDYYYNVKVKPRSS